MVAHAGNITTVPSPASDTPTERNPMNKQQAETLWANLRSNLLAAEDNIRQIIATRAWEPLGYDTFAACWADRLSDLKLAGELRAVVVYAMFDDGATDRDVALAVDGVGVSTVTALRDAHRKGLDAGDAAYTTRSRGRARRGIPGQTVSVNIVMSEDEHRRLSAAAAFEGCSMKELARVGVLRYIDGMEWVA